jgi:predicted GNAT family acetyltransferase
MRLELLKKIMEFLMEKYNFRILEGISKVKTVIYWQQRYRWASFLARGRIVFGLHPDLGNFAG